MTFSEILNGLIGPTNCKRCGADIGMFTPQQNQNTRGLCLDCLEEYHARMIRLQDGGSAIEARGAFQVMKSTWSGLRERTTNG